MKISLPSTSKLLPWLFLVTIVAPNVVASPFGICACEEKNELLKRAADPAFNYCPAASFPATGPGQPETTQTPSADLQDALSEVSPTRIKKIIKTLVGFGTRNTLSTQKSKTRGIGAAKEYIHRELLQIAKASNGRMKVTVPCYMQPKENEILFPVKICDVVATLKGSVTPDRYYLVSGHYDSRNSNVSDYTMDAPGADDDGSGVAVSLELARAMATRKPRSTLVFSTVAGEEQGLYGSNFLAQKYKKEGINIAGMLNNDIVGAAHGESGQYTPNTLRVFCTSFTPYEKLDPIQTSLSFGGENDTPARELGRFILSTAQNTYTGITSISLMYRIDRFLRGGDHESYLKAGYLSAVRFTEPNENFHHQHQNVRKVNGIQYGDLPQYVDYDYNARVARVNLAAMYSLSEAPAAPKHVKVNATILTNKSTFIWDPVNEPDVDGYEILWRPTDAPLWTNFIDVGNGFRHGKGQKLSATVDLSKDNVVFGIRTRGSNGFKSPATFALMAVE